MGKIYITESQYKRIFLTESSGGKWGKVLDNLLASASKVDSNTNKRYKYLSKAAGFNTIDDYFGSFVKNMPTNQTDLVRHIDLYDDLIQDILIQNKSSVTIQDLKDVTKLLPKTNKSTKEKFNIFTDEYFLWYPKEGGLRKGVMEAYRKEVGDTIFNKYLKKYNEGSSFKNVKSATEINNEIQKIITNLSNSKNLDEIITYLTNNLTDISKSMGYATTEKLKNQIKIISNINKRLIDPDTIVGNSEALNYITKKGDLRAQVLDKFNNTIKASGKVMNNNSVQSFLLNKSSDELLSLINSKSYGNNAGWYLFGSPTKWGDMSGWKFHVFGEDLVDSAYLIEKLEPIAMKWGASAKVGTKQSSLPAFQMGNTQYGKQGVTMYIPQSVIDAGSQKAMLSDIQNVIKGYGEHPFTKGGTISGDKMITPQIHYRYELSKPIKYYNGTEEHYHTLYAKNVTGQSYKPTDVSDIFQ